MLFDPFTLPFHQSSLITKIQRYTYPQKFVPGAGTVVFFNPENNKKPLFLLIHRGSYWQDWTFPKGVIEDSTQPEKEALRETYEEVGLIVKIFHKLPTNYYSFYDDIKKERVNREIHYYLARSHSKITSFSNNPDQDEAESFLETKWVNLATAINLVKNKTEKNLLQAAGEILGI